MVHPIIVMKVDLSTAKNPRAVNGPSSLIISRTELIKFKTLKQN